MSRLVIALLALLAVGACMEPHPESTDRDRPTELVEPSGAPSRVRIGGVQWYVDYDAAVAIARERNQPLWVHFGENPG